MFFAAFCMQTVEINKGWLMMMTDDPKIDIAQADEWIIEDTKCMRMFLSKRDSWIDITWLKDDIGLEDCHCAGRGLVHSGLV